LVRRLYRATEEETLHLSTLPVVHISTHDKAVGKKETPQSVSVPARMYMSMHMRMSCMMPAMTPAHTADRGRSTGPHSVTHVPLLPPRHAYLARGARVAQRAVGPGADGVWLDPLGGDLTDTAKLTAAALSVGVAVVCVVS